MSSHKISAHPQLDYYDVVYDGHLSLTKETGDGTDQSGPFDPRHTAARANTAAWTPGGQLGDFRGGGVKTELITITRPFHASLKRRHPAVSDTLADAPSRCVFEKAALISR